MSTTVTIQELPWQVPELESTKNNSSYHKELIYDTDVQKRKEGETGNHSSTLKQKSKAALVNF